MITVERSFEVDKNVDTVHDYLRDFGHATEWDPGTKSCDRTDGPGPIAVGATWHNVSELKGRETELTYELRHDEPDHLTFVGTNKTATSTDDIRLTPARDGGSRITYRAQIVFNGVAKLAQPFLDGEFERLGDATVRSLTRAIAGLA
jgi:carbon monoxide dehydrogenase subunit G